MTKPSSLNLVSRNSKQLRIVAWKFLEHLVRARLEEKKVNALLSKETGIAVDEVEHL